MTEMTTRTMRKLLALEREVRSLERQTGLEPWADGARDVWVRITPVRITGRRLQS